MSQSDNSTVRVCVSLGRARHELLVSSTSTIYQVLAELQNMGVVEPSRIQAIVNGRRVENREVIESLASTDKLSIFLVERGGSEAFGSSLLSRPGATRGSDAVTSLDLWRSKLAGCSPGVAGAAVGCVAGCLVVAVLALCTAL